MRFLNALGIGAACGQPEWTVLLLDPTHNPAMAAYADRTLVLCDGRVVDDLRSPTAEQVLDRMQTLGARP